VAALADGKVFLGAEALELGLVDELSDLATAAVAARTAAGIGSALPVELFPKPLGLAAALGLAPAGAQAPAAALSPQQALAQWADLPAGLSLLLSDMRSGRPVVLAWQGIPQIR
jgi:protease-4